MSLLLSPTSCPSEEDESFLPTHTRGDSASSCSSTSSSETESDGANNSCTSQEEGVGATSQPALPGGMCVQLCWLSQKSTVVF